MGLTLKKAAQEIQTEGNEQGDGDRLNSGIDYVTPKDKLEGRAAEIFAARDTKLEAAREMRKQRRQQATDCMMPAPPL